MTEIVHSTLKKATKGTVLVFAGSVGSVLLWFAVKVLIIRGITTEEFGIYALVTTIAGILCSLASLGIGGGATRYISLAIGKAREEDIPSLSRSSLQMGVISGTATFVLLFLLAGPVSQSLFYKPELAAPLRVISFTVPLTVMIGIISSILRGHNIIRPKVYFEDIGKPLFFLALIGVVLVMKLPFIYVIGAFTLSVAIAFVSISTYGYKKIGLNPFAVTGGKHRKELLKFSFPLLVGTMTYMVITWTDTLMLGRYTTSEAVGVYNVSISLARLLLFALNALMFVFLPMAGEMYGGGHMRELERTYQVLTKWVFSATLPIFFVLCVFPEMTITFLFGERLVDAAVPLRILSLGMIFSVFFGANGLLLVAMGYTKTVMNVSLFSAALNVVLNYIFIKRLGYGTVGAAVASMICFIISNILVSFILYRRSRIHPLIPEHIKPVLGSAAIGLIIYAVAKSAPLYIWMLPLYFVLFVGGYVLSLFLSRSLGREDVEMLYAISEKTGLEMRQLKRIVHRFSGK